MPLEKSSKCTGLEAPSWTARDAQVGSIVIPCGAEDLLERAIDSEVFLGKNQCLFRSLALL